MENPSSPLETLRQLKEMLDAGTITPAEFDALKQQLVFRKTGAEPAPVAPLLPFPAPITPGRVPDSEPLEVDNPTEAFIVNRSSYSAPAPVSNPPSNPLNLVLIIGGALAVLALVLYLTLGNRTPDEHLTSTTQTAADSLSTLETGPVDAQAQITLPPVAAPETIRVAPAHPATPITRPQPTPATIDSSAAPRAEKSAVVQDSAK